jgi:hypothetical protein
LYGPPTKAAEKCEDAKGGRTMSQEQILAARIAALEQAFAELQNAGHQKSCRANRNRARTGSVLAVLAGVAVVVPILLLSPATRAAAPGLGAVTEPFVVTDKSGRPLLTVSSAPDGAGAGGGQVSVYNSAGEVVAQMTASSGCCGRLMVFKGGERDPKVIVGVNSSEVGVIRAVGHDQGYNQISGGGMSLRSPSGKVAALLGQIDGNAELDLNSKEGGSALKLNSEGGEGLVRAYGSLGPAVVLGSSGGTGLLRLVGDAQGNRALFARGDGKLSVMNLDGVEVMATGADTGNQGYLVVKNAHGGQAASLSVGGDGTGLAQLWKSNEVGVILGTKNGTNGDVCANGPKSSVCLSLLAAKTFTQY